jgi:hypothetical protein
MTREGKHRMTKGYLGDMGGGGSSSGHHVLRHTQLHKVPFLVVFSAHCLAHSRSKGACSGKVSARAAVSGERTSLVDHGTP